MFGIEPFNNQVTFDFDIDKVVELGLESAEQVVEIPEGFQPRGFQPYSFPGPRVHSAI